MQVRIGVQSVPKEITVETEMTAGEIEQALSVALSEADRGILRITDDKGGNVLVPVSKIGYVEIANSPARSVGFGH